MSESRSEFVHETIIRRILSGEYRPGQPLNRRDVASSLDVSISPVNEAFAILQVEGIVQTVPRKGTFVDRLDWRDLTEFTVVRVGLEVEAARYYCGARIAGEKGRMFDLAAQVDDSEPVTYEYLRADVLFHRALVELAGNRYLSRMLDMVMTRSLLLAMEASLTMHARPGTASHRKFVRDLCKADPNSVGAIVRRNVFSGKEDFLQLERPIEDSATPDTSLDVVLSMIGEKEQ